MKRNWFDQLVWLAIIVVFAVGFLALVGWIFDITLLKSVNADWIAMKIVTVFSLWCCAAALFFAYFRRGERSGQRLCLLLGILVGLVGLLSCLSYVGQLYSGQEMSWVFNPLLRGLFSPGSRMAPLTALLLMGYGFAFVFLSFSTPRTDAVSHALTLPVAITSYMVIVGYFFHGATLITWMDNAVAFHTGGALLALSIGIFCARPDTWFMKVFSNRGFGGRIARRLLPALLAASLLIGWLRYVAVQSGFMNMEKTDTLAVTGNAVVMLIVMWFTARSANITDELRQGAEEALRKAHDELELRVEERTAELAKANAELQKQAKLLELAHDAILVRDLDSRIVYWNKGAERTYGWKAKEAGGKIAHELLKTTFPKPLEAITSLLVEKGEWQGELIHTTHGNIQIIVESRWALQRDSNGTPAGFLEINRDITARKMAESSMRKYAEKLEKSNQVLQDFAFIASHDLQEPLRKIHSFGDRLKRRYADTLGETGRDYLERMLGAADRMSELLHSLLAYSRITTKTEPFVHVDLGKLAGEVVSDLEVPILETRAQVEIGELPGIQADPSQMRQLFQNLIGNALKYHKDDEPPHVKVYSNPCWDGSCEIFVEDNGIGFDEKHIEKIFAPFQRLHGRASSYKGSGMGLAICRKITDRHNGSITARSTPGKGTTFIISLPVRQCEEKGPWVHASCTA